MLVTLELHEIEMAVQVGLRRRLEALRAGMRDRHGFGGDNPWEGDIQGAAAELAVAKHLGRYWDGSVNTFKRGDVGEVQVRSTPRKDGSLIVRRSDSDTDHFILVTGAIPEFNVIGWISGAAAKSDEFKKSPNGRPPAWFVPQRALHKFPTAAGYVAP